jgi:hypothetical protein
MAVSKPHEHVWYSPGSSATLQRDLQRLWKQGELTPLDSEDVGRYRADIAMRYANIFRGESANGDNYQVFQTPRDVAIVTYTARDAARDGSFIRVSCFNPQAFLEFVREVKLPQSNLVSVIQAAEREKREAAIREEKAGRLF